MCAPLHVLALPFGPSPWPRRFLAGVAKIAGARVRSDGAPLKPHTLVIANHVSWLDIPLLGGLAGCAFVSKDDLRGHPVMHWLCVQNGTVFIDRSDKRGISAQTEAMLQTLAGPRPLVLFPEGTVSDGGQLLPFRPPLLSAFAPPPPGVTVRPVAIDYGPNAREFGWPSGENGKANFLRLLGRRGRFDVCLHLLDPLPALPDRKQLARAAHDAVAAALAPSGVAPASL